jgi:hypothetical protein
MLLCLACFSTGSGCTVDGLLCVEVRRRETTFSVMQSSTRASRSSYFAVREREGFSPNIDYLIYVATIREDSLLAVHVHDGPDSRTVLYDLIPPVGSVVTDSTATRWWTVQGGGEYSGDLSFTQFYQVLTTSPVRIDFHTRQFPDGDLRATMRLIAPAEWQETRSCSA